MAMLPKKLVIVILLVVADLTFADRLIIETEFGKVCYHTHTTMAHAISVCFVCVRMTDFKQLLHGAMHKMTRQNLNFDSMHGAKYRTKYRAKMKT